MPIETKVFKYKNRKAPVEYSTLTLDDSVGPNEILVETHYVGLNPVDIKYKTLAFYDSDWTFGLDFSGVVTKAGSKAAERFQPGDKVCGFKLVGPFNSSIVGSVSKIDITRNGVMHQPKVLSDQEAGAFSLVFSTAWEMIKSGTLDANGSVLVLGGATSVGCLLVQLLKRHFKVKRVVATCSSKSADEVKSYGADEIIDYRSPEYLELLKQSAEKERFLNLYDCVGGYQTVAISGDLLLPACKGSTYITINGDVDPHANYSQMTIWENVKGGVRMGFRQVFGRFYNLRYKFPFARPHEWPTVAPKIVDEYKIHVKVGKVFPAAEIKEAWKALDGLTGGKIVLKFA